MSLLLRIFVALCLACALVTQALAAIRTPVKVTVFYESQCPDSKAFVIHQLLPAVLRAPELVQPVLIPYGKATTNHTEDGYAFTCQHGPTECLGNKLHACAIALTDSSRQQVSFAACMMNDFDDVRATASACADELGLSKTKINKCASGQLGSVLLSAYGAVTADLDPAMTSVPTVQLNEEQLNQTAILDDLWGEVSKVSAESVSAIGRVLSVRGVV